MTCQDPISRVKLDHYVAVRIEHVIYGTYISFVNSLQGIACAKKKTNDSML